MKNKINQHNTEKWFQERIGKTIYRGDTGCKCMPCRHVRQNGLIISDNLHAMYLHDVSSEEGIAYFDEPVKEDEENNSNQTSSKVKGGEHLNKEMKVIKVKKA